MLVIAFKEMLNIALCLLPFAFCFKIAFSKKWSHLKTCFPGR